ncbi:rhomboid family intramembrane serine protease [Candidatus Gracilibacteria bacterium]|nr:rhomboid family intramembrane serine protease [Candidatus Gracilibacteria bacterium]
MQFRFTISNILILISAIFTLIAYFYPSIYILGINNNFLDQGIYSIYLIQFFTGTFLHAGLLHFLANALFLYLFGNILEVIIGKKKFILFFIFILFFNGFLLSIFSTGNNVGISGFCMALISYYTLELKSKNNPEYKGGITALLINIGIGFVPGISLLGHLFGAIGGVLFYLINKKFLKLKFVGPVETIKG